MRRADSGGRPDACGPGDAGDTDSEGCAFGSLLTLICNECPDGVVLSATRSMKARPMKRVRGMRSWWSYLSLAIPMVSAACGSVGSGSGDAGYQREDASTDAGSLSGDAEYAADADAADSPVQSDSGAPDSGSFACGTATCGQGQLCVHPCCGGAAPSCLPEAGGCSPPFVTVSSCPGTGKPGCMAPPCTPDPPFCIDAANQCESACACTGDGCAECRSIDRADIMCLCA
jgi:hypothetical protein